MKTKLKIGTHIYSFTDEALPSEMSKKGNFGNFIANERLLIRIRGNIPKSVKKETTLHELFHGFLYTSGIDNVLDNETEELVSQSCANQLILFIENNKKFFKDYFLE